MGFHPSHDLSAFSEAVSAQFAGCQNENTTAQRMYKENTMNRRLFATLAVSVLLAGSTAFAQNLNWTIDKNHAQVDFQTRHMSVSTVRGSISGVTGTVVWDEKNLAKSSVNATIDATTVNTGNDARDKHLKSPDFFDVATYSTATFTSTSVTKTGNGLAINGNLTLHGVTKPVVLTADGPRGPQPGMDHKPHAGFSATTIISRSAFGIGAKFPGAVVGDDVKLNIDLEVVKQ